MNSYISESRVIQFLDAIEQGDISLQPDGDPQDIYAGNVTYTASNGWRIVIFNDANEWDYIDSIATSDGQALDFDEIEQMPTVTRYKPSSEIAWNRYGIPGYCVFRCKECGTRLKSKKLRRPPFLCQQCQSKGAE